jgi:hypothetical protein
MGPRSHRARFPFPLYIEGVPVKTRSELPDGVIFHDDIDLLVWKPVGIVTEPIVNIILSFLEHHETVYPRPFNRFTDTSAQEGMELDPEYVLQVALYRRMIFADRPPVKSAFYVIQPEIEQLIAIHAMVTNPSALKVAMFDLYEEAAAWLGVPLTRLQAAA